MSLLSGRDLFLLGHTVLLGSLVTAAASLVGVALAVVTEQVGVPARRLFVVLLVLPLAMPDFVVGFVWHSLFPRMNGLLATLVVMTLGTYPLVYLPTAAALRRSDPVLADVAASLGVRRGLVFWRVTLPLLAPAVAGGALLSFLTTISEYGAFETLRYQTLTTAIFAQFQFDPAAAAALCLPLAGLGILALIGESLFTRSAQVGANTGRAAQRRPSSARLSGRPRLVSVGLAGALALLAGVGVALPVATIFYWLLAGTGGTLTPTASLSQATWTTLTYGLTAAAISVGAALLIAISTRRRGKVWARSSYLLRAVPGVVVAVALVELATHFAYPLYQSSSLLVLAYTLLNLPLALVAVRASFAQLSPALAEMAASLGRSRPAVLTRGTLPLVTPGLLAGFSLVFLACLTELTATLLLAPIGVQTLATQFWALESEVAYGTAAPYALAMVGLALVGGLVVALRFESDRGFVVDEVATREQIR